MMNLVGFGVYVSNYEDEIWTLMTSRGVVLGPTKSKPAKICSYEHALQDYHKFSRGELVHLGIRFFNGIFMTINRGSIKFFIFFSIFCFKTVQIKLKLVVNNKQTSGIGGGRGYF